MAKLQFRTPYLAVDPPRGLSNFGPSLAQQHMKDDVDINVLLERFKVTGQMPQAVRLPSYGDFRGVDDYQSAMNVQLQARNNFMELPAKVRAKFRNSPQAFLEFCADPKNADEMIELGLAKAAWKPEPKPTPSPTPAPTPKP